MLGFWGEEGQRDLRMRKGVLSHGGVLGGEMENNALGKVWLECCKNAGKVMGWDVTHARLLPLPRRIKISSVLIQALQSIYPKNTQTTPKHLFSLSPHPHLFPFPSPHSVPFHPYQRIPIFNKRIYFLTNIIFLNQQCLTTRTPSTRATPEQPTAPLPLGVRSKREDTACSRASPAR